MQSDIFSHFVELSDQWVCKSCCLTDVDSFIRTDIDCGESYDSAVAHCRSCHFTETVELDQ